MWGFLGSIDSSVHAECVLLPRGGTYQVVTTTAGTVYDMLVERDDHVAEGQAVAVVETVEGSRVDVVAPFSGNVVELLTTYGDFVDVGADILNFKSDEEAHSVLLYLPATVSGQVRAGMEVRVALATARREQFGFLLGHVDEVAPYPSTLEGMEALLNNDTLTQRLFAGADGTPVEVWVAAGPRPRRRAGSAGRRRTVHRLGCATARSARPTSSSANGARSTWCGRERDRDRRGERGPCTDDEGTTGSHADGAADGSGGVRRGGAGDGPRLPRPRGAAGRAARARAASPATAARRATSSRRPAATG